MNSSEKVTNKIWRIIDLINWGVKYFQDRSFENPRLEIEIFLQHIFGYKKIDLYINFEEEVMEAKFNEANSPNIFAISSHLIFDARKLFK